MERTTHGKRLQEAMFFVADAMNPSAFYFAADTWRHDQKTGWGLCKSMGLRS